MARHNDPRAAAVSAAAPDADRKAFAGLQAELALAGGYVLQVLAGGGYVITRWNLSKHCPDLAAVRAFLGQVRGPAR